MEQLKFCPLFSGSNGNSIFISYKKTKILIDCGCSFKRIKESLNSIGEDITKLDAVFLTHSHTDHTSALPMLLKNLNIKVCGTKGTLIEVYPKICDYSDKIFQIDRHQNVGVLDLRLESFPVPHDACHTVGYNIYAGNKTVSLLTDVGHLAENLYTDVKGKELVFLESNHDLNTLENCSYPFHLKQRIRGDEGHLSNDNAGKFAAHLVTGGTKKIILGHLSGEANTSQMAYETVKSVLAENSIKINKDMALSVSERGLLGEMVLL
ncbi:MAG: MBL fold metallo-hydrolase [Clostridia bacterium]|nr:MBL fold metallo-hydrolase [Clostridia bacterium]